MPATPTGLRWHEDTDIGIVGAGGCGLVAAHAAVQEGLRVVIWERGATPGGTTALSRGMFPAAGSRVQRDAGGFETGDDLAHDILARNGQRGDAVLTHRLCESAAALAEWLIDVCGVPLVLVHERGDPGHSRPRLHAPPSRHGRALVDGLVARLNRRGITLRLSTPVLQVWTDATGAVVGVQIKRPHKSPSNVRCGKLILAGGGFGGNRELLMTHCPDAARLPYAGAGSSTGDALTWAADIGAATRHLGSYAAYATAAVGSNLLLPWELVMHGAILVNQRGERFGDDAAGPVAAVTPLLAQPGRIAYEIFDGRILKAVDQADPYFATEIESRVVRRAEELTDLARQFQIDADTLQATVSAYNQQAASAAAPHPLTAPFYGIRVTAVLLETQGGLSIDSSGRVLRPDGTIVPNLYAGGAAVVGLSGPSADSYLLGNGLLAALGWGKIAGDQAAHELLAARAAAHTVATDATESEPTT